MTKKHEPLQQECIHAHISTQLARLSATSWLSVGPPPTEHVDPGQVPGANNKRVMACWKLIENDPRPDKRCRLTSTRMSLMFFRAFFFSVPSSSKNHSLNKSPEDWAGSHLQEFGAPTRFTLTKCPKVHRRLSPRRCPRPRQQEFWEGQAEKAYAAEVRRRPGTRRWTLSAPKNPSGCSRGAPDSARASSAFYSFTLQCSPYIGSFSTKLPLTSWFTLEVNHPS